MINIEFKQLNSSDDIQKVIDNLFEVKLDISGGWGYDSNTAVIIEKLSIPYKQFYHMFATMRANIEMNLTLEEDERYGGINLTFEDIKQIKVNSIVYDVVSFKFTAMNEKVYAKFIKEYKDGYGKKEFDLSDHFKRRTKNTIVRHIDYWFLGLKKD